VTLIGRTLPWACLIVIAIFASRRLASPQNLGLGACRLAGLPRERPQISAEIKVARDMVALKDP
jgi:hypothetical protein